MRREPKSVKEVKEVKEVSPLSLALSPSKGGEGILLERNQLRCRQATE